MPTEESELGELARRLSSKSARLIVAPIKKSVSIRDPVLVETLVSTYGVLDRESEQTQSVWP